MTKADLAEKIRDKLGFQRKDSVELVELVLDILKDTLAAGEEVKISGFGKFDVKKKSERNGRNPHTGEGIVITGRKILTFKPSAIFKASINS